MLIVKKVKRWVVLEVGGNGNSDGDESDSWWVEMFILMMLEVDRDHRSVV